MTVLNAAAVTGFPSGCRLRLRSGCHAWCSDKRKGCRWKIL